MHCSFSLVGATDVQVVVPYLVRAHVALREADQVALQGLFASLGPLGLRRKGSGTTKTYEHLIRPKEDIHIMHIEMVQLVHI